MAIVKAERFTALKAKVKAEMLRRDQSGSVAAYGGSAYDYTEPPAAGKTIRQEHRDLLHRVQYRVLWLRQRMPHRVLRLRQRMPCRVLDGLCKLLRRGLRPRLRH